MRFIAPTVPRRTTILPLLGVAMIPAVLVLVLVCASLNRAEELVRLPAEMARPPAVRVSPVISVQLSRQGVLTIAGQTVAIDARAAAWQREQAAVRLLGFEPAQATVVLRGDPDVPAGTVQQVIEQAQQAGFQRCMLRDSGD